MLVETTGEQPPASLIVTSSIGETGGVVDDPLEPRRAVVTLGVTAAGDAQPIPSGVDDAEPTHRAVTLAWAHDPRDPVGGSRW